MLQFIRERAQGWLAGVIVVIVCVPFALWGIQEYLGTSADVVVARVDGEALGLQRFQDSYQRYRRQLQALAGEGLELASLDESVLRSQALQQMVEEELLLQAAHGSGMRIGDEQVRAAIQSLEPFQRDGQFSRELYQRQLRIAGMGPVGFEVRMRRDMLADQWRQGLVESAFVTEAQVRRIASLERQKRDLRYAVIEAGAFRDQIEISDAEIERHYEANPQRYSTPEQVRVAYLELSLEALAAQIPTDDATLEAYFEANEAAYRIPEERSASHVLVQVGRDAPESEIQAARELAGQLHARALAGESIAELAESAAQGEGPVVEGGETGLVRRGVLPPEFDEALFALEAGAISEPVRTDFGFHVIRVLEIKPGSAPTFEQVREDVARDYRREQAGRLYYEQAERLSNLTFEQPDTLEGAAEELGLEIRRSPLFARDGASEGIAAEPAVVEAAFSTEVLLDGTNSEPIELGEDRMVVLRVLEHEPEARQPLEAVREAIRAELLDAALRQRSLERGRELLERLRAGEDPAAVAEAQNLSWEEATGVDRRDPQVNRAIVRQAFRMPRPEPGAPRYEGVALGTGDYALIELRAVHDVDPQELDPQSLQAVREALRQRAAFGSWRAFLAALERHAKVETYPGVL